MFYSEKVKKAALIAYNAHKDQSDKGGYPYIMHPIHIAEQMETEDETIAALLHDVIEDTDIGFDYLKKEGFSDTVINCLKILTKDPNEDYMDYIRKIKKTGGIALKIKKQTWLIIWLLKEFQRKYNPMRAEWKNTELPLIY